MTRIAALRVDFIPDTLSTTTGDGGFDYGFSDTIYFDPPPHDSLYFTDNLEFLRFYWREMSAGAVDMEWDVYPAGDRVSFRLPKQIWQYNWNSGDEQLNRGLAELFRDAVTAADTLSDIVWNDYDLVIIFHAGAGAEFSTGFDTTPHDIPSAWMVKDDFQRYLGMPDGIPVDGGMNHITGGLILPETESQEDIQISSLGVICSLFGHWLGAPALYDKDDGKPVVGKWSLMDRGFGNFYGALPGELDAWSRSYMGWLVPITANADTLTIRSRVTDAPSVPQAVKIPITDREYFLLECRDRDPENDSVAIAYDRGGRQMVFHDDYSVTYDPGFRVPVRADNLDFDSPGSGILIWHVDESLTQLIQDGRFNSVDERRGLDLEEADGAQDIGQDYPFLTPGWGTDYGVFEDAWYGDNDAHKAANQGNAVTFGDETFPNSRANSGAFTHIELTNFSRRDSVMTLSFANPLVQDGFPIRLRGGSWHEVIGNFDSDPYDEIMVMELNRIEIIDGDGTVLGRIENNSYYREPDVTAAVADLNGDGLDDVITFAAGQDSLARAVAISSGAQGYDLFPFFDTGERYAFGHVVIGGPKDDHVILLTNRWDITLIFDSNLRTLGIFTGFGGVAGYGTEYFLFGGAESDTFLVVDYNRILLLQDNQVLLNDSLAKGLSDPALADFDRSGELDIVGFFQDFHTHISQMVFVKDLIVNGLSEVSFIPLPQGIRTDDIRFIPVDVDGNGGYELFSGSYGLIALEINGVYSEGFPKSIMHPSGSRKVGSGFYTSDYVVDTDSDGRYEYLVPSIGSLDFRHDPEEIWINIEQDMSLIRGDCLVFNAVFSPLDTPVPMQLDDDPNLEYVSFGDSLFTISEIPCTNPAIWWGSRYRDKQNRNAVWEPARPFSPSPDASLMPVDLCYNWPNPAEGSTAFRFFLNYPAAVSVSIYDLAGEKVADLTGPGDAGQHNEIQWNLFGVPRGVYFANVKAVGAGRTETRLVKVAVR